MRPPGKEALKRARRAVERHLQEKGDQAYVSLFALSTVADTAARRELYSGLDMYESLLPAGARCRWLEENSQRSVLNPYYNGLPLTLQDAGDPGMNDDIQLVTGRAPRHPPIRMG